MAREDTANCLKIPRRDLRSDKYLLPRTMRQVGSLELGARDGVSRYVIGNNLMSMGSRVKGLNMASLLSTISGFFSLSS